MGPTNPSTKEHTLSATLAPDAFRRLAATTSGAPSGAPLVFGHGLGTDQTMWRDLVPAFEHDHRVVVFDHAGAGRADADAYDPRRHGSLEGYADDLIELVDGLGAGPVAFVGHSASAMIGVLAQLRRPELFSALVLIGGSPRYLDDDGYVGGFSRADVEGFLESMEQNYLAWIGALAPLAMGNPDRPELAAGFADSLARTDQQRAIAFARAIFLSDHRDALPLVSAPTLVLQAASDPMVPAVVAEHMASAIPDVRLVRMAAEGHFPHLSGPGETIAAIRAFLDERPRSGR